MPRRQDKRGHNCKLCLLLTCTQAGGEEAVANPVRMPDAERRIVRGRMAGMHLHPSFNRKFRDPFSNLASWQIDDCARAMQCFLPMLLRPARSGQREMPLLRPEAAKKAFGHLKRFAAFHLGHVEYKDLADYKAAAKASVNELIAYGALMEKVRSVCCPDKLSVALVVSTLVMIALWWHMSSFLRVFVACVQPEPDFVCQLCAGGGVFGIKCTC